MSIATGTPETIGRYRILRRLASGGLAQVFLGVQEGPDGFIKPVAVKRLHAYFAENSSFINMLADEARVTARLDHPNIAQVLEFNYDGDSGDGYLVYEFVPGRTLSQLLRFDDRGIKGGRGDRFALSEAEAIAIGIGAARALHYAAERVDQRGDKLGVVHRDLSPPNIMVSYGGVVKVIDFGIAQARHRIEKTETGVVKGKFRYMSPEQLRGDALTHPSDLYSLGTVLYELVHSEPLFTAEDDLSLMAKVQAAELPDLSEALPDSSEAFRDLLTHLMAKQLEDRLQSGAALAQRLQQILIEEHGIYDGDELLSKLLERRFPGAGRALEQELSLAEAPVQAEGVSRQRSRMTATAMEGQTATMTIASELTEEATMPQADWAEQPTIISRTVEKEVQDTEGLVTDVIDRSAPSPMVRVAVLGALFALVLLATFLLIREFRTPEAPPVAAKPTAPVEVKQVPLRIACPPEAVVVLHTEEAEEKRSPCPFAEVMPVGRYEVTVKRGGYRDKLVRINLQSPTRYPDVGSLPMTRLTGSLRLTIEPADLKPTVRIDGEPWSDGDLLLPGEHRVLLRAKGFIDQRLTITIEADRVTEKRVVMQKPTRGFLRVLPPKRGWFDVYHEGKKVCSVPPPCERLTLPSGTQTLELRSVGPTQMRRVQIRAGAVTVLNTSP